MKSKALTWLSQGMKSLLIATGLAATTISGFGSQATNRVVVTNFGTTPLGNDGAWVQGSDGYLYGSSGADFHRIKLDGTGYAVLVNFSDLTNNGFAPFLPLCGVDTFGTVIYTADEFGGTNNRGTMITYDFSTGFATNYSLKGIAELSQFPPQTRDNVNYYLTGPSIPAYPNGVFAKMSNGVAVWQTQLDGTYASFPNSQLVWGLDGYLYGGFGIGSVNVNGGIAKIDPDTGSYQVIGAITNGAPIKSPTFLLPGPNGEFFGLCNRSNFNGVFRFDTNSGFQVLHTFGSGTPLSQWGATLTLGIDGALYGVTRTGGTNGFGNIFRLTTNGLYSDLYSFKSGASNGKWPFSGIFANDGTFVVNTTETNGNCWRFTIPMPTSITSEVSSTNGTLLTFPSVAGHTYQVQWSTNLPTFNNVGSPVVATSNTTTVLDSTNWQSMYRTLTVVDTNYSKKMADNSYVAPPPVNGMTDMTGYVPPPNMGCTNCTPGTNGINPFPPTP